MKKRKSSKQRTRPTLTIHTTKNHKSSCLLCGNTKNLTKTECCDQWICDDEGQYRLFSYATNSCHRNHSRYTLCSYHFNEQHPLSTSSIALTEESHSRFFTVTHCFHPLYRQRYVMIDHRHNWGDDQVFYQDENGKIAHIPARWTSVIPKDPFVYFAKGESYFHTTYLLELVQLIEVLKPKAED